ncbi:MAG: hypothetical protein KBB78_02000 [Candidatus Pacebacteria bacterium]|nr:hypothetical protein [Candidatus Paceibacterota bacterium]
MKQIIFEKYKIINLFLFLGLMVTVVGIYFSVDQGYCVDRCSLEFKKGFLNPIFSGGKWLAGILAVLLFVPSRIFRKWLFYIAPPILLLTFFLVQGISVYSTNLLNPTRAKMAENGMMLLAVVTVVFVIGHAIYDRRKKKIS